MLSHVLFRTGPTSSFVLQEGWVDGHHCLMTSCSPGVFLWTSCLLLRVLVSCSHSSIVCISSERNVCWDVLWTVSIRHTSSSKEITSFLAFSLWLQLMLQRKYQVLASSSRSVYKLTPDVTEDSTLGGARCLSLWRETHITRDYQSPY